MLQLKDALTVHFTNIREADSCFGHDHAELLMSHIKNMRIIRRRGAISPEDDAKSPDRLAMWPFAVSKFAPQATINPQSNIGELLQIYTRTSNHNLLRTVEDPSKRDP
jgi:hypothetical protein